MKPAFYGYLLISTLNLISFFIIFIIYSDRFLYPYAYFSSHPVLSNTIDYDILGAYIVFSLFGIFMSLVSLIALFKLLKNRNGKLAVRLILFFISTIYLCLFCQRFYVLYGLRPLDWIQ